MSVLDIIDIVIGLEIYFLYGNLYMLIIVLSKSL